MNARYDLDENNPESRANALDYNHDIRAQEMHDDGVLANNTAQDLEKAESRSSASSSTSSFRGHWYPEAEEHSEGAPHPGDTLSLSRSVTIQRASTRTSQALNVIRSRQPRGAFQHPLEHQKTSKDNIVDFDGPDDPYRPLNWPMRKKYVTTVLYGLTALTSSFASSVFASAIPDVTREFHIGDEVASLGTSLYLIGLGLGPLLWGPLSEVFGRKQTVLPPVLVSACFAFGCGAAKDVQTIMICRFFQGFWGSAPVTNTGGVLGDIWTPEQRGAALVLYSIAVVGGPTLGPIVGGAIVVSGTSWRWCQYVTGILQCAILVVDVLVLDESYAPRLLVAKARRLRIESGNWALHAKFEEWDISLNQLVHKYLIRPFQLIATPICALVALYASFVYGLLYASLASFPIEFQEIRGWNSLVGSLPFLAMLIGVCIAGAGNLINQRYFVRALKANNYRPVPEARLPPMMIGSIVFTAGLFMFAWSSDKDIFWLVPVIAVVLIGIGFLGIFQAALNYLIDTFQQYAASAVAANTFLRSVFAAAFPLFISYSLHGLGVGWGMSVYGFVSALLIPIPFVFYIYGKRIRARGKWSRASVYPDE